MCHHTLWSPSDKRTGASYVEGGHGESRSTPAAARFKDTPQLFRPRELRFLIDPAVFSGVLFKKEQFSFLF